MLKTQNLFMILLTVISLTALALSLVCVLKKEKYEVLTTNNDNIGLQNIDIATKTDVTNQITSLRNEMLNKHYISWGDTIQLHANVASMGGSGCSTFLSFDDNCNLITQPNQPRSNNQWTLRNPVS